MKPSVTPLRYPGGKTWLLNYVKKFLSFHKLQPDIIVEPYAGSASISIGLLRENLVQDAYICEKDPLIGAFWKAVKGDNDTLVEFINTVDVSLETWYSFKKYLSADAPQKYNPLELAESFLFYNRTNYSGIILGGPLGGKQQESRYKIDCRFNREKLVRKVKELGELANRIHLFDDDGLLFMRKTEKYHSSEKLLFYIDPPYHAAGKVLYRNYFNDIDHRNLAVYLKTLEFPWLLSYDESDFISELYSGSKEMPIYTDYQAGHLKKNVKELLFSNRFIPPLAPETKLVKNPECATVLGVINE